jgi:hypothetical protein
MVIKVLYCVFLGALIVLFVGWAMAAWYPMPTWEAVYPNVERDRISPEQPQAEELKLFSPRDQKARWDQYKDASAKYEALERENQARQKTLDRKIELHNRGVSLTSLIIAVVVVALSVGVGQRLPVISEGLLLGGLFTLIYSIGWSFIASPKVAVIPVGVGLIVTIFLGYRRFVKPRGQSSAGTVP